MLETYLNFKPNFSRTKTNQLEALNNAIISL